MNSSPSSNLTGILVEKVCIPWLENAATMTADTGSRYECGKGVNSALLYSKKKNANQVVTRPCAIPKLY